MDSPPATPFLGPGDSDIKPLLSPTKARLAAATAQSWSHVSRHLERLFAPAKVPPFERNDATLQALLALVRANEEADEEARIVHEARVEALEIAKQATAQNSHLGISLRDDLLRALEASLPPQGNEALDALSTSAVLLSCPSGSLSSMESRILEITADIFAAENELRSLQATQRSFEREITRLQATIERFRADTDPETLRIEEMQVSTATMNRETKVVGMKLAEYQERIKVLEGYDVGSVRIEDVTREEGELQRRQDEVKKLEAQIVAMHGLPPDLEVSRKEVERARNELEEWKRRRDRAFEGLVE